MNQELVKYFMDNGYEPLPDQHDALLNMIKELPGYINYENQTLNSIQYLKTKNVYVFKYYTSDSEGASKEYWGYLYILRKSYLPSFVIHQKGILKLLVGNIDRFQAPEINLNINKLLGNKLLIKTDNEDWFKNIYDDYLIQFLYEENKLNVEGKECYLLMIYDSMFIKGDILDIITQYGDKVSKII